jgi:hypothetical protein
MTSRTATRLTSCEGIDLPKKTSCVFMIEPTHECDGRDIVLARPSMIEMRQRSARYDDPIPHPSLVEACNSHQLHNVVQFSNDCFPADTGVCFTVGMIVKRTVVYMAVT